MKKKLETECTTTEIPTEYRGVRRFIPYCDGTGYRGVITKYAKECKAKDCWNYRELDISNEPDWIDEPEMRWDSTLQMLVKVVEE